VSIVAWCSRPTAAQIRVARDVGCTGLALMLHDDSEDRTAGVWETDAKVHDYCARIRDAGLELHLTAWVQPHVEWLERACDVLVEMVGEHRATSVCWDAEEPWTRARGGLPLDKAASLIQLYGIREGVSGIGYAPRGLDPLMARAAYVVPQCYATTRSGSLSLEGIPRVIEGWQRRAPHAVVQPALACYSQNGTLLDDWTAAGKPHDVWLWSLRHIVGKPDLVRRLRDAMGATT
jgi:hypothetical protein